MYLIEQQISTVKNVKYTGGRNTGFTIVGGQNTPKLPQISPNRHFAAKSAKSLNSHLSVTEEDSCVKFDTDTGAQGAPSKNAKLGQRGS